MKIPSREEAGELLTNNVNDEYQLYHAKMVATAMAGYARKFGESEDLWYVTGLLHDIDFQKHPEVHPAESLKWFKDWQYHEDIIHAVEAHAYNYNGFTTLPQTKLAAALMACDEVSGIFYAYRKLNPIPYSEIKLSSIMKRIKEENFAAKIKREDIRRGCELLGVSLEDHVKDLLEFFKDIE